MKKYIIITLCLMAMIAKGQDIIPTMRYIQENITGSGGVTEITYDNLVQAIDDGDLTQGAWYLLTDFRTVHYFTDGVATLEDINTGELEPLLLLALAPDEIASQAYSYSHTWDVIHYDWNPVNWLNDVSFSADQATIVDGWKGIITYRWDTKQDNSTGYDFRNVKFRRWALDPEVWEAEVQYSAGDYVQDEGGTGVYRSLVGTNKTNEPTTSPDYWVLLVDLTSTVYWSWQTGQTNGINVDGEDFEDFYTFTTYEPSQCFSNQIGITQGIVGEGIVPMRLNNIVFHGVAFSNTFDVNCVLSTIGADMYGNTIGTGMYGNTIGAYMQSNTIGAYMNSNTIGAYMYGNTIGANMQSNTIGANMQSNTIGTGMYGNTIGANMEGNTIGANMEGNTIGANMESNTIGASMYGNAIGAGMYGNTIGAYMRSNTIGASMYGNTIGANVEGNTIGAGMQINTIGADIRSNTIGDSMTLCTFHDGIQSTDFTAEPLMSASYTVEVKLCSDYSVILEYIDCSGENPVTVLQAVTPPEEPEP